ncbi:hypothetical protein PPERSA_04092 [Pseudocohnilembus persalinus]|uniref:Uncharacterized protein n=1 Tax=Pseudocohnilembus persalinus TaxID=266149 RepID=A0A0V0QKP7_PSEPJ|nr:hypothetical protein PPERSA_04092 [Pseudocohnilembus persalinus]|eukprot:KRX02889.1 hypothetical protein PPERSA_04092 [Pseudocohnilembus persalinus]
MSDMKQIMKQIQFSDILPIGMPFLSCQTKYLFLKYLVMPFLVLDIQEQQIKLLEKSRGLLQNTLQHDFLNHTCIIYLHHIEGFTFRLVFQSVSDQNLDTKLDIEFDKASYQEFFKVIDNHSGSREQTYEEQELQKFFNLTDSGEIVDPENKELKNRDIIKSELNLQIDQSQKQSNKFYEIDSLVLENKTKFLNFLEGQLKEVEFFINNQLNIQNFGDFCQFEQNSLSYLKLKIQSSIYKGTLQFSIYRPVEPAEVQVIIRNNFESFGHKGSKIKECGISQITVQTLERNYGLNFEEQDIIGKKMLLSFAQELFVLKYKQKMGGDLMKNKTPTKFQNNPIVAVPMICGSFQRTIVPTEFYNLVLTIELIGVSINSTLDNIDKLQGVKCVIYNPQTNQEKGVFLSCNDQQWKFTNTEIRKKLHHKHIETLPLSDNLITHLFKKVCIPLIVDKLQTNQDFNKDEISPKLDGFQITNDSPAILPITRIESIFSVEALLNFYKENFEQKTEINEEDEE